MTRVRYNRNIRVLFDEAHSESWSASRQRAVEINPGDAINSSYQAAADALATQGFLIERNGKMPLGRPLLENTDVVILPHPCDPKWERTTSPGPPRLTAEEIDDLTAFVRGGGGLLAISEYEYDKYGSNLNELLAPFGLAMESTTVIDRTGSPENPSRVTGEPVEGPLAEGVHAAHFYQAGSCTAQPPARIAWQAPRLAQPPEAGLIGIAESGEGRVVLVSDSSLFGDEHFPQGDHERLWLNILFWLAAPAFRRLPLTVPGSTAAASPAWSRLKAAVNALRAIQNPDGSAADSGQARRHAREVVAALDGMEEHFPNQHAYLAAAAADMENWVAGGFGRPDFARSLAAFSPQSHRVHNCEHIAIFPIYTPNASGDTRFEALIFRTPWPEWLAELEEKLYRNERFVPGHFVDFTAGYDSHCAVLFPEMVSVKAGATNNFAIIFCDREARRLQWHAREAAAVTRLPIHPQLECFLESEAIIQDAAGLWDLIHDTSHSLGELPFDPFVIRQRAPYWMYALEELRVDLQSYCEAARLACEGFPFAIYATYAILLDRIFRFPISGTRVRNYDALGGQLLFACLHQHDVLVWRDNRLTIAWERLTEAVSALRDELARLYKLGADCSRMNLWLAAHDLIAAYIRPNVASKWKAASREVSDEASSKKWIEIVQDDEFPLGAFHLNLQRRLRQRPQAG